MQLPGFVFRMNGGKIMATGRSTGPRTELGKRISSLNSLRHGLFSRSPVVRGVEDQAEYERFARRVLAELDVRGVMEMALAERVISTLWRLRRVTTYETAILSGRGDEAVKADERVSECDSVIDEETAQRCALLDVICEPTVTIEVLDMALGGIETICRILKIDAPVIRRPERRASVRRTTAKKALERFRRSLPTPFSDGDLSDFYVLCARIFEERLKAARKMRAEAEAVRDHAAIRAMLLTDDEQRPVDDAERRLQRQLSRALEDFYKFRACAGRGA